MLVCVGGGIAINRLSGASEGCVCGLVSGGGRGVVVWGWHCWWWGGWGWMLRWLGVWASCRGVWVLRVRAVRSLWSLAGTGAKCGWEAAAWASAWGCGPQVVDGSQWMVLAGMGCSGGGCWWWCGAPIRPWCCWCTCAAPRGSMGVCGGPYVVSPCSWGGRWCWIALWWC